MDIKQKYAQTTLQTKQQIKTARDPMRLVTNYLINLITLCSTNNICFFISKTTRTPEDERNLLELLNQKIKGE